MTGLTKIHAAVMAVQAAGGLLAMAKATKVAAAGQWLFNAAVSANPLGLIIGGLVALGAGLVVAYKKSETFRKIVDGAFSAVKSAASAVASFFTKKVPDAFEKVKNAASKALGWVKSNWPKILAILTGPFGVAALLIVKNWDKIKAGGERVLDFIKGLPGKIKDAFTGAGKWLLQAGKDIVNGLISGIGSLKNAVVDALLALIPGPLKKFAGRLGIHSPSTVFHGFGVNVVQGFVKGIDDSRKLVDSALGRVAKTVAKHGKKIAFSGSRGGNRHGGLKQSVLDMVQAAGASGDLSSALDGLTEAAQKAKTRGMAHFIQGVKDTVAGTIRLSDRVAELKDQFAELSASIAAAFKPGDLFSGSAAQLFSGLTKWRNNLTAVKSAQATLLNAGLSGDFLKELFSSGNVQLIGQLAANPSQALEYQSLFESASGLAKEVGDAVAQQATSADVMAVVDELAKVRQQLADQPDRISRGVADAVNNAAAAAAQLTKKRRK